MVLTFINILAVVILLVCLCFLAYWFIAWKQGNCAFVLLRGKRSPYRTESMDLGRAVISCTVPVKNAGRQNGTLMDVFVRPYMPQEQYDKVGVRALLMDTARPRRDDYWEALIVEPGKTVELRVEITLTSRSGNILRDLEEFPDLPMDIIYQIVGRSDWTYEKGRIYLERDELRDALYNYKSGGMEHGRA